MIRFARLRARLLALVLAAMLPGLVLALLERVEDRRQETARVYASAREFTNLIALQERQLLETGHEVLVAIAHAPVVASRDHAACSSWLEHLLSRYERLANLGVADIDGNVICSAVAMPRRVNIADREYFRLALARRGFATGVAQTDRIAGRSTLNLAYPIETDGDRVRGVVWAAVDLERLNQLEREVMTGLPAGVTLTKIDSTGRVLVRQPDPGRTIGQVAFDAPLLKRVLTATGEAFLARGSAGEPQLFAVSRVTGTTTAEPITVVLSVPEATAFAGGTRALHLALAWLALAAGFALTVTWVVSERLVIGPTNRLVHTAGRLAAGDLTARSGIRHDGGEIGVLARAFDAMAEALERREAARARVEAALRTSELRLSSALKIARLGHWEYDVAADTFTFNDEFYAMMRTDAETVGGYTMSSAEYARKFLPQEEAHRVGEEVRAAIAATDPGYTRTVEHHVIFGDGSQGYVAVCFSIAKDAEGRTIRTFGANQDLTQRKRLEAQLTQAQKMEAVGRLAAGVAHDFNNLLTIILGYCDLVSHEAIEQPVREGIGLIRDASVRAVSLTRQLLAFSRRQVIDPRVLDLNAAVASAAKLIARLIGEDVKLSVVLAPDLGRVRADPAQIEQTILNLAVNARDAMASGGALSIETANVDLDEAYAAATPGVAAGPYVMLAVSDTGTGMDAETQARIFEPFFTTKEMGKGTGLGLATVYGAVKQSGGHIRVCSDLGQGTTFKVYLPRVDAPAEAPETGPPPTTAAGGTETVLLVEDDASLRRLAQRFLEQAGYVVLEAPSAYAALEVARLHSGAIQLLVTDVILPGMNGAALATQLLRLIPGVRVLYVSGYADDAIASHGVLEPDVDFLAKPYTQTDLATRVREILDRT